MDSKPTTEVAQIPADQSPESRLQRLLPVVRSITSKVRTLSIVSAGSAVVLWWIWFNPHRWIDGVSGQWAALAVGVLLVLLIPAGAAFVGHLTLKEILDLPQKLKGAATGAAGHAKEMVVPTDEKKGGRLFGFFRAIWAARGLVLDSKGAWGTAVAAVRLARLASLPFVVGLLITFALNFVVIAVAVVAVGFSIAF